MISTVSDAHFSAWCQHQRERIEHALQQILGDLTKTDTPEPLVSGMRWALEGSGKRLRPLLTLAVAQTLGQTHDLVLQPALAVELLHSYSLVHDDMPCMDNDSLRRGKPTVHVQFGEAMALLVGDALQSLAFEHLTNPHWGASPQQMAQWCRTLATAGGYAGMCGGQAWDILVAGQLHHTHTMPLAELERMHRMKTGALLRAAILLGAQTPPPPHPSTSSISSISSTSSTFSTPTIHPCLSKWANTLGLAFQVVDDVLDTTSDAITLGKTAGKDAASEKPTYVSVLGVAQAQTWMHTLSAQAHRALDAWLIALPNFDPTGSMLLHQLTDLVTQRSH